MPKKRNPWRLVAARTLRRMREFDRVEAREIGREWAEAAIEHRSSVDLDTVEVLASPLAPMRCYCPHHDRHPVAQLACVTGRGRGSGIEAAPDLFHFVPDGVRPVDARPGMILADYVLDRHRVPRRRAFRRAVVAAFTEHIRAAEAQPHGST